ncbi:hypothetical protein K438DRAFT_1768097 [Mycena galopus ATCC 62051]|nr:hypothetical protein K438DRAFT_1768097 [Mycena galopus ATCC 62051]
MHKGFEAINARERLLCKGLILGPKESGAWGVTRRIGASSAPQCTKSEKRARGCGRAGMTHSLKEGKDRIESRKNTDVHSQEAGSVEETEASDERAQACLERRSSHRGTWRKEMRGETSAQGGTNGGDGRVRGSAARDYANGEAVVSPQHVNGEKINISSQDASDKWCAVPWSVANVGAKAGLRLTEKCRIPDQGQEVRPLRDI